MAKRGCTGKAKTSKNRIEADERQTRAVELRMEGKPLSEIAAELSYAGPSGAAEAIKAALKRNQMEATDSYRQVMEARLDKMLERLWPDALDGDLDAMGMVLKIEDRRARLFGMDRREAPVKVGLPKLAKAEDGLAVVSALLEKASAGELLPDEAGRLAAMVQAFMKIAETTELAERLASLEAAVDADQKAKAEMARR